MKGRGRPIRPEDPPVKTLFALLLCAALPAAAQEVTTATLDNGMEVVVIEDHRAPAAVHMVWYRTGSADEPPGVSGVAHFLEHLLFKATDDMEDGEFSVFYEEGGRLQGALAVGRSDDIEEAKRRMRAEVGIDSAG